MTDKCPQCCDNRWFSRIGIKKYLKQIHEEAVREANEDAKVWATSDYMNNSSLTWNKLWIVHFTDKYQSLVNEKRKKIVSEYETECYRKSYGEKESQICSYHSDCRY